MSKGRINERIATTARNTSLRGQFWNWCRSTDHRSNIKLLGVLTAAKPAPDHALKIRIFPGAIRDARSHPRREPAAAYV